MQQRKRARERLAEAELVELLDRLDLGCSCRCLCSHIRVQGAVGSRTIASVQPARNLPRGSTDNPHRRDAGALPSSNPCRCFHDGEAANCGADSRQAG